METTSAVKMIARRIHALPISASRRISANATTTTMLVLGRRTSLTPWSFGSMTGRSFTSGSGSSSSSSFPPPSMAEDDETSSSCKSSNANRTVLRQPVTPHPWSPHKSVPAHIKRPPYADTGMVLIGRDQIVLHNKESADKMRMAARLARRALDVACQLAKPGVTTDEIDTAVHEYIIANNAYPSPLNYAGFPKSICSSINEVICHGIPDTRPLKFGDVVSFDVSCYLNGVHGDNCATVIIGDEQEESTIGVDWRGVPYKETFEHPDDEAHFLQARQLVQATREAMYAGIEQCRPGGCLSDVGNAIHDVADNYGYDTVTKYRGHGISSDFHHAPYVNHYRNKERCPLVPGMIFTIEPMFTELSAECYEWDDHWTVATVDGGLAAQFEHTVLITHDGVEILTVPK